MRSSSDQGEFKYFRLMQELYALEKALNIKMLPDMARDSKNLTKFTEKEQYDYDIVNCFYNKKQGKKIFEQM